MKSLGSHMKFLWSSSHGVWIGPSGNNWICIDPTNYRVKKTVGLVHPYDAGFRFNLKNWTYVNT